MSLLTRLLDLLFPPKCPFCRKVLESGASPICSACQNTLPRTEGDGSVMVHGVRVLSPLRYEGSVRKAIHRYKFGGCSSYAAPFGDLMAECVKAHPALEYDLITWVPLSSGRQRERGYDQAFLLAKAMGKELGCDPTPLLQKVRHTPAQSSLKGEDERRSNVKGAYALLPGITLKGKRILLVDDVVTTGSTLSACAALLRKEGACVTAVTFARAKREK